MKYFSWEKLFSQEKNSLLHEKLSSFERNFYPWKKNLLKKNLPRRKIKSVTVKKIPDTVVKYYCVWYLFNCNSLYHDISQERNLLKKEIFSREKSSQERNLLKREIFFKEIFLKRKWLTRYKMKLESYGWNISVGVSSVPFPF